MIALLPAVLPNCGGREGTAEFWGNEREIIELSQRLKLCEYRLGLSKPEKVMELDGLKARLSENESRLSGLQSEKASLTAEITSAVVRLEEMGRAALAKKRSRAQGMKFETLSARDGRTFKNVTITMVEDAGVAFRHEHGAARLRYAELPDERRSFFGLEETSAMAAEDRERREALAYERHIDSELAAIRESEASAAATDEAAHAPRPLPSLLAASSRQPETRELAQPARPVGSGSSYRRHYYYSGYRDYRPVYRYVYRHPVVPNPFCPSYRTHNPPSGFPSGPCPPTPSIP